jgi:hypothetical protein
MENAAHLGVETLNAARRWSKARKQLRRMLDSKKATPQKLEAAKRAYEKGCKELESGVDRLDRLLHVSGAVVPMKKASKPFPWEKLFGLVSEGAKALESAVEDPKGTTTVIDAIDATPRDKD